VGSIRHLWKKQVFSLKWKSGGVVDGESDDNEKEKDELACTK